MTSIITYIQQIRHNLKLEPGTVMYDMLNWLEEAAQEVPESTTPSLDVKKLIDVNVKTHNTIYVTIKTVWGNSIIKEEFHSFRLVRYRGIGIKYNNRKHHLYIEYREGEAFKNLAGIIKHVTLLGRYCNYTGYDDLEYIHGEEKKKLKQKLREYESYKKYNTIISKELDL